MSDAGESDGHGEEPNEVFPKPAPDLVLELYACLLRSCKKRCRIAALYQLVDKFDETLQCFRAYSNSPYGGAIALLEFALLNCEGLTLADVQHAIEYENDNIWVRKACSVVSKMMAYHQGVAAVQDEEEEAKEEEEKARAPDTTPVEPLLVDLTIDGDIEKPANKPHVVVYLAFDDVKEEKPTSEERNALSDSDSSTDLSVPHPLEESEGGDQQKVDDEGQHESEAKSDEDLEQKAAEEEIIDCSQQPLPDEDTNEFFDTVEEIAVPILDSDSEMQLTDQTNEVEELALGQPVAHEDAKAAFEVEREVVQEELETGLTAESEGQLDDLSAYPGVSADMVDIFQTLPEAAEPEIEGQDAVHTTQSEVLVQAELLNEDLTDSGSVPAPAQSDPEVSKEAFLESLDEPIGKEDCFLTELLKDPSLCGLQEGAPSKQESDTELVLSNGDQSVPPVETTNAETQKNQVLGPDEEVENEQLPLTTSLIPYEQADENRAAPDNGQLVEVVLEVMGGPELEEQLADSSEEQVSSETLDGQVRVLADYDGAYLTEETDEVVAPQADTHSGQKSKKLKQRRKRVMSAARQKIFEQLTDSDSDEEPKPRVAPGPSSRKRRAEQNLAAPAAYKLRVVAPRADTHSGQKSKKPKQRRRKIILGVSPNVDEPMTDTVAPGPSSRKRRAEQNLAAPAAKLQNVQPPEPEPRLELNVTPLPQRSAAKEAQVKWRSTMRRFGGRKR